MINQPLENSVGRKLFPKFTRIILCFLGALALTFITYLIKHSVESADPLSQAVVNHLTIGLFETRYIILNFEVLGVSFLLFFVLLYWNKIYSYIIIVLIIIFATFSLRIFYPDIYKEEQTVQAVYNQIRTQAQQRSLSHLLSSEQISTYFIPEAKGVFLDKNGKTENVDLVFSPRDSYRDGTDYTAIYNVIGLDPQTREDRIENIIVDVVVYDSDTLAQSNAAAKKDVTNTIPTESTIDIFGNKFYVIDNVYQGVKTEVWPSGAKVIWPSGNKVISVLLNSSAMYGAKEIENLPHAGLIKKYLEKYPDSLK